MVYAKPLNGKNVFICGECGLKYAGIKTAEDCEKFCGTHKACSPKIAALAISK